MNQAIRLLFPVFLIVFLFQSCAEKAPKKPVDQIFHQKRVLFLGNSITQNGTYVSVLQYLLKKNFPEIELDIISIGLSSETVSCLTEPGHPYPRPCLKDRLDRALQEVKPDVVFACYGMNDGIYHPLSPEIEKAYQEGIALLRSKVEETGASLTILTPPPFDPLPIQEKLAGDDAPKYGYSSPYQNYDQALGQFAKWLMREASEGLTVIDWHTAINKEIQERRSGSSNFSFAQDGVHPNPDGHVFMAKVLLEGLGMEIVEPAPLNWATVSNDPLFEPVHKARQERSGHWLRYVGYTRGETVSALTPKPILILMGGQSNMVGSGKTAELENAILPKNIQFVDFGLNGKPRMDTAKFGPEIGLSEILSQNYPHQSFILLKYAVGGSSLLDWSPYYSKEKAKITGNERFGNMYRDFFLIIDSLKEEQDLHIAALLWMQGERDARIPDAGKAYYENFSHFINAFRTQIEDPDFPILFGIVNPPAGRYPALKTVVEAQKKIAQEMEKVDFVETDDLEKWEDNLHYNTQGQLKLGEKFGVKLLEILNAK